jgi:hypothetical protein
MFNLYFGMKNYPVVKLDKKMQGTTIKLAVYTIVKTIVGFFFYYLAVIKELTRF